MHPPRLLRGPRLPQAALGVPCRSSGRCRAVLRSNHRVPGGAGLAAASQRRGGLRGIGAVPGAHWDGGRRVRAGVVCGLLSLG